MAFSKMAGFAVTPRMPSSSLMRLSSPDLISLRPIRSSHALWPNSLSLAAGFVMDLLLGVGARAFVEPFGNAARDLGRREIVRVGERLLRRAGAEAVDADHQPVADDPVPVVPAGRFDRDETGFAVRDQLALFVARPVQESLDARH